MRAATSALILGLLLFGCTGTSAPGGPDSTVPEPTQSASPSLVPVSDIQFLLGDDTLLAGGRVSVRIKNVGDVPYNYQGFYAACYLSYFDSRGREFIIPPGTHCDIRYEAVIQPGEIKRLFVWELDECLKDQWGCMKSRSLHSGTYSIRGAFRPVGGGLPARARITFEIQPSY